MQTSARELPAANQMRREEVPPEMAETVWNPLYRMGGGAALLAVVLILLEAIVMIVIQMVWLNSGQFGASSGGQPSTIIGWFTLFQHQRLIGLLDAAVLDIAVAALLGPLFLALFVALRHVNTPWMTLTTVLAFIGIAAYVVTNNSFALLFASDQYAAATTNAQRSLFVTEGQATLALGGNGLVWSNGFLFVAVAGLIVAVVMRTSQHFGKSTAWVGIVSNGLLLASYLSFAFVPTTSVVSIGLVGVASLVLCLWWILLSRKLFQLGRNASKAKMKQPTISKTREATPGAVSELYQG
jgi:Domain of unknown function (DUF4386)